MCGICGKLDLTGKPVPETLLEAMCRTIAHRGPDDHGILMDPPVGLGHQRLSIIDPSPSGHQPMSNEDGTVWLVYNGEIYDFENLRRLLLERGHRLSSRTDGEVLIHLYEDEGVDCLRRLNGMFAFALWDAARKRLWVGRDRLGIKPLCYFWDGSRFVFGSEIKAILSDPEVPRRIDPEGLDLYLSLNYVPPPYTLFRGVRKLSPGCHLVIEEGRLIETSYWDITAGSDARANPNRPPEADPDPKAYGEALFKTLDAAVRRRLIADVPLGAFLSGGLDSSIIVGLMARHMDRPVQTFSIGYRDLPSFDETAYAREVADFHGTDHHEFRLDHRDVLDAFPAVLKTLDEPFADSSAVPTFIVSRETRRHVTVALSGDGGDELFAGYRMYQGEAWARAYGRVPGFLRNGLIAPLVNLLPERRNAPGLEAVRRAKKFVRGMSRSFTDRYCGWREIFPLAQREALLQEPLRRDLYRELARRAAARSAGRFPGDVVNRMLYLDVRGLLHADMLTKVDRMSMANALEVRVPMLDHTVVECAFAMPGGVKLRGRTGKAVLLEAFRDILPPSLLHRPKMGFEMPINAWLRGELRFLVDEYLNEEAVGNQGIFRPEAVTELVRRHMGGFQDTSWHLWNLIVFSYWHRSYIGS
ncbi:MAG: asparagine synthase (glutamine-hydrolyzing) [Deltaproteobacteria bacterium]|nr:asparagine synthase (glutamine-hydrolyzing) [Deltaproteobacteria bacterium]